MATPITTTRSYSAADDDFIRQHWQVQSVYWIARQLGRHPGSVSSRATGLGLLAHGDSGEAARRAIVNATQQFETRLSAVAARHGVQLRPVNRQSQGAGA